MLQPPAPSQAYPGCFVSPDAEIAENVELGVGTVVHAGAHIGRATRVQEYCVLGAGGGAAASPLVIGAESIIRSHSVLYGGSTFGPRLETGHHVVLRERTTAGINFRVGNYSDVEGDCSIGDYVRCHGFVHIGKGTRIGHFVWLFSLNTTLNDPLPPSHLTAPITIEDGAVICFNATLMPGVTVGLGAYVTAGTTVRGDVPPGSVVAGTEGTITSHVTRLFHMASGTSHPWMTHFADAYPAEARPRIAALLEHVKQSRKSLASK